MITLTKSIMLIIFKINFNKKLASITKIVNKKQDLNRDPIPETELGPKLSLSLI